MAHQWSEIEHGLIKPPDALEVIASDHCNLTCRQCNHASPIVAKWNVDPDDAFRDLALLAPWYRPRRVKILGGEPLLNPRLPEVISAVRKSGITPRVLLVTNGVLLRRLPLDAWRNLDEVEISMYPGSGLCVGGDRTAAERNSCPIARFGAHRARAQDRDLRGSRSRMAHMRRLTHWALLRRTDSGPVVSEYHPRRFRIVIGGCPV